MWNHKDREELNRFLENFLEKAEKNSQVFPQNDDKYSIRRHDNKGEKQNAKRTQN